MTEVNLTHYVVVRRDLPLGVACAQIAHAAGESFYAFSESMTPGGVHTHAGTHHDSVVREGVPDEQVRTLPWRPTFDPSRTKAIILGARNEGRLLYLHRRLVDFWVDHVLICEPDEPYCGQLMAIGLHPTARDLRRVFNSFNMLTRLDTPS